MSGAYIARRHSTRNDSYILPMKQSINYNRSGGFRHNRRVEWW